MARDDGKRYGAGGVLMKLLNHQTRTKTKEKNKEKGDPEERIIDTLPSDVEEEKKNERFKNYLNEKHGYNTHDYYSENPAANGFASQKYNVKLMLC